MQTVNTSEKSPNICCAGCGRPDEVAPLVRQLLGQLAEEWCYLDPELLEQLAILVAPPAPAPETWPAWARAVDAAVERRAA